jgi:hypothetical protein
MDAHLTNHPREGVLSMVHWLQKKGYPVGPKRIRRMFKIMWAMRPFNDVKILLREHSKSTLRPIYFDA